ncbi:ATP-binding protein [Neobacillus niacini]|uniref:ATP-binding protein n=1 Tax=Neobacillus niacini TaxID=86668 RepID=UPI0021CB3C47|nr:ATP-binding protein [Neobacillus niacini]MCM3765046.1 ATP-binding protein [Neobacillus niacini]
MKEGKNSPKLIFEEKKAITLFLSLFYLFYFTYEIFWYFILPKYTDYGASHLLNDGLGYWLYFFIIMLLPISLTFIKKGNPYIVKYILLFGFILFDGINSFLVYFGSSQSFASGNIVELLFVFFSPVFVNKQYYWSVTFGLLGRYLLLGLILQDGNVMSPMLGIIILSGIAFILLIRFFSYIKSITNVYEELNQKEKLAVIGQMAAAVGHEIRNPLASLKGFTQLQIETNAAANGYYPIMIQEIDRINSIVDDLMYLGRPREPKYEKANIEQIINYTLSLTNHQAVENGVTVETIKREPIPLIDCDEGRLKQLFINLIKNAIEAMPDGGRVRISIQVLDNQKLEISIEDEGLGISKESINNLFEPFYTTKKDGTGLGLIVSHQIIKDHNGDLRIESEQGNGTRVIVSLPITQRK